MINSFLPFTSSLIPSILDGSKTSTYRFGLKYDHLQIGERIDIVDSDTQEVVGQANVTSKAQVLFQDIPLISSDHQSFASREEMRDHFSRLYNYIGRAVEDSDVFLAIGWEMIA
jgi:hypothetical protein